MDDRSTEFCFDIDSHAVVNWPQSALFSGPAGTMGLARGFCRLTCINMHSAMVGQQHSDQILDEALKALSAGEECRAQLDELPAPIYTTDIQGRVTYWNRACIEFAGREPELGQDRWSVTWQLYTTTGDPLRHEDCPMAQAIKQQRPIRDVIAIAERPDGKRVAFRPYPTPLFNEAGEMIGAVNMLVDVTEEQSHSLHDQADRCRRLAEATYDRATSKVLGDMASSFERTAGALSSKSA